VFAIAGSLRERSYNRALLRASAELAPDGLRLDVFDLAPIPPYNMDLEPSFPEAVVRLKDGIRAADGLLIAVPEHNFSFSGVLKNAIDWASRPPNDSPLDGKPVILQSASTSWTGGVRAQLQLRQVLGYFPMLEMRFPEVFVSSARDKFDDSLNLTDESARERIAKQLAAFKDFILAASR
jgi:chromate reductase